MVAWDEGILTDPADHVHHRDENHRNNDPSNLEALSASAHASEHGERSRKTHCSRGHELTEENTHVRRQGFRECRTCIRDRARKYRAKKKQGVCA